MNRRALLIILILLLASLLAGCGSQTPDEVVSTSGNDTNAQATGGEEEKDSESADANNKKGEPLTEQSVHEYIDHITKTYRKEFVLVPYEEQEDPLEYPEYRYRNENLKKDKVLVSFQGLSDLISSSDVDELLLSLRNFDGSYMDSGVALEETTYRVQYADEMQEGFDEIWGKGKLNILELMRSQNPYGSSYLSEDGVLINEYYPDNEKYEAVSYYDILDIDIDGDTAEVSVICVVATGYSYFSDLGYAVDNVDGRIVGNPVESDWLAKNSDASFDQVVSFLGIDRSALGEYVFTVKNSPQGPFIESIEKLDQKKYADDIVMPEIMLEYPEHCEVNISSGLNLRMGPGTEYDLITLLPDKLRVTELGYNSFDHSWIFVSSTLDGAEHFGWVNREYIHFYGGMAKPVIYLYPEEEMEVSVEVAFRTGGFTCTYPDYSDGWNVIAHPDGHLINNADGQEYSYLYWEGEGNINYDMSRGFVVKGEDTATFLQEKLAYMGLTPREYNEFIVYWLPLMHNNTYNLITFQTTAYTSHVALNVTPKPDSMLRVYMVYKPLDEYQAVPEQELVKFDRKGFSVIEWGGSGR